VRPTYSEGTVSTGEPPGVIPLFDNAPFWIIKHQVKESVIFLTTSSVSSDLIVDRIHLRHVRVINKERFPLVKTLVIYQDNGPEYHSRRTQFMKRITQLNGCWGVLENYWNDSLLDTLETVFYSAQPVTYNGVHPVVEIVKKPHCTGVKLIQKAMDELEKRFEHPSGFEKYLVRISPLPNPILE
jgi:hypothetical protein